MVVQMKWVYEEKRIYLLDEKGTLVSEANLSYKNERTMMINRIYVEPEYRNRGFADQTMRMVMEYVVKNGLEVLPVCPYAVAWMEKKQR